MAISYEFEPCDKDKSVELSAIENNGVYEKSEHEDIDSIAKGLLGYKGKIHVEFGTRLNGEFSNSKAIAEEIDRQIIKNYKISNYNQAAFEYLSENKKTRFFETLGQRMSNLSDNERKYFINMYANPIIAKND